MENEEKKEFLNSYRYAVKREKEILDEIQRLRAEKMFPSLCIDGMPKQSSQTDLSGYAAKIDEMIQELKEERLEKIRCYEKIERSIRSIESDIEKEVLRLRYIKGMKWEEIAVEIEYSWKQMHRIHSSALMNLKMT